MDRKTGGRTATNHPRRQRFTIAHELGHWFLHPGRPYTVDSTIRVNRRDDLSSLATDREEIEANAFAASILMPEDLVQAAAQIVGSIGARTAKEAIVRLANRFEVSEDAMSFRLHNLGLTS